MIIEQATVIGVEGNTAWVETVKASFCGGCQAKSGCGQSLLQRYVGRSRSVEAQVPASLSSALDVGDPVEIGIADNAVLLGSLISYGIPVLSLVIAIAIGEVLLPHLSILFALSGLLAGFYSARFVLRTFFSAHQFTPVVLARVSDTSELRLIDES